VQERGVIVHPKKQQKYNFSLGLGDASNNIAESYGLFQGLNHIVKLGIQEVFVISDSLIILSQLMNGGIVTLWLQDKWIKIAETMERHWIKTTLQNKMSSYQLIIFNVYVLNHYRDKEAF